MTDNILGDIDRLEYQARYGIDGLAGYARIQRQEAHNYRAQRDAALTRLHEVREVRKQLGGLLASSAILLCRRNSVRRT